MTVRERIEAFWAGEQPDRIPYSIYWGEWYRSDGERDEWQPLFDAGLGVTKHAASYASRVDDLEAHTDTHREGDDEIRRVVWRTSVGEVWADWVNGWHRKYWLETADDYRVMAHIARHTQIAAAHDRYRAAEAALEPQEVLQLSFGRTPIQTILVDYVGLENFGWHCFELAEPMAELYDALLANTTRIAEVVAEGPGRYVAVMENFTAETLGPKRYAEWLLPVYERLFPMLREAGKVVGTHYDGQIGNSVELIRDAPMDLIESFTPPPEGDLTVAEARAALPNKLLWSNLNVGCYQLPPAELRRTVLDRVADGAVDGRRFAFEVSEHWPRNWRDSMPVVLDALAETRVG